MTARHQRQLAKAKARRQRGRQDGHRHLPNTGPLTAKWHREGRCHYQPGQVEQAIAAGGDVLHHRAMKLAVPHIESLCGDYCLEPETVLNLVGADLHAAALVTLYFDIDCLTQQVRSVRRFLNQPDIREHLDSWRVARWAS